MTDDYPLSDRNDQRDEPSSFDGNDGQVESSRMGSGKGIIARFFAAIRSHVPPGYEDETGFHVGTVSPEK
jgi:hypothetical protein